MKKIATLLLAFFFTAGLAFGQSTAVVDQIGDDNQATIDQVGTGITSVILQNGNTNRASASMANPDDGAPNQATSAQVQIGDGNKATIDWTQTVERRQDTELIQIQAGSGNKATMDVRDNLLVAQIQVGDDNKAKVDNMSHTMEIAQLQVGDDNVAKALGAGSPTGGVIYQIQQGDRNKSLVTQYNSITQNGGTTVGTEQIGNDNLAKVDLHQARFNEAFVYQEGDDNRGVIRIDGTGNLADIYQFGSDNRAKIEQFSNGNVADINQTGSNNHAVIMQH